MWFDCSGSITSVKLWHDTGNGKVLLRDGGWDLICTTSGRIHGFTVEVMQGDNTTIVAEVGLQPHYYLAEWLQGRQVTMASKLIESVQGMYTYVLYMHFDQYNSSDSTTWSCRVYNKVEEKRAGHDLQLVPVIGKDIECQYRLLSVVVLYSF